VEGVIGDGQREVLGHLAPADHRPDRMADGGGAAQRVFCPLHAGLDAGEVGLGRGQRLLALAGPFLDQQWVAAHTTMRSWVMRRKKCST
jgi:hypothetical protein